MVKVAVHNLGCKVNSYEIDVMQQELIKNGYKIVPFDQKADIYVVNTCSVTNVADKKSRQMLHRAKKMNPDAIVVALGCYVQTAGEKLELDDSIDLAIGNNKKKELVPILKEYLMSQKKDKTLDGSTIIDINHTDEYEEMTLTQSLEHTRAYIKIQDGCNQFCSYCIIPFARGRVRSRKHTDIMDEIKGLCEKGYQEFVLTGIHISSYGMDMRGLSYNSSDMRGEELVALIREIATIDGVKRIRLGSFEPCVVTEEFAKAISGIPQVCPHFHLSLQSGCDETLKRMNRQYTTKEFENSVKALRKYYENPAITTDVITGFPQETEEEFAKTREFVEGIHFFETHIFPYSKRQGTVAAGMDGQLTEAIKKERSAVLLEMEKKQSKEYRELFVGLTEEVLLEEEKEINDKRYMIGHTTRYVKVAVEKVDGQAYKSNELVSGKITGLLTDEILLMG